MLDEINVHCVFGEKDKTHIQTVLIPSLLSATSLRINLHFLNFTPGSGEVIEYETSSRVSISTTLCDSHSARGFAANHNFLFSKAKPQTCFLIINPDCIATPKMIDIMLAKFNENPTTTGIVEAAQWPYEHPKEFDRKTGHTPWASGACMLINSTFYAANNGMDERFFLYAEDVDLSWASWLTGYGVIYLPTAKVIHFTQGPHQEAGSWSNEYLYGLRNHVLLLEKYFGPTGRAKALRQVRSIVAKNVFRWVKNQTDPKDKRLASAFSPREIKRNPHIKVFGKGLYHRMQVGNL